MYCTRKPCFFAGYIKPPTPTDAMSFGRPVNAVDANDRNAHTHIRCIRTTQAKKEEISAKTPADIKFEEMQQYANNLDVQVITWAIPYILFCDCRKWFLSCFLSVVKSAHVFLPMLVGHILVPPQEVSVENSLVA